MGDLMTGKSVTEQIADRIREGYVSLVPEDAWRDLVDREIQTFTTAPRGGVSPLQAMVREEIKLRFQQQVAQELDKPHFQEVWNQATNRYDPPQFVTEVLRSLTPDLVTCLFSEVARNVTQQIRSQIQGRSY